MREKNGAWAHWAIASAITCQRSGPDAGAFAAALPGAGDGATGGGATFAGGATFGGTSAPGGAPFGGALEGTVFICPESVFVPSAAIGGRPGSGTPVGAGATVLDGSTPVAGPGAAVGGLAAGAAVEATSCVAGLSVAGATGGEGGASAGLGGSTAATVSLPSPLSIR